MVRLVLVQKTNGNFPSISAAWELERFFQNLDLRCLNSQVTYKLWYIGNQEIEITNELLHQE
jgi:hypothetical protein